MADPCTIDIAVVAGATRGAGRGIACMLGEAGATVYCTGRSVAGAPPASGHYRGRPETIEETAAMVAARGGAGIAVRTDHASAADVAASRRRSIGAGAARHPRARLLGRRVAGAVRNALLGAADGRRPGDARPPPCGRTCARCRRSCRLMLRDRRERAGRAVSSSRSMDGPSLDYRSSLFFDLAAMLRARLAYAVAEELAPRTTSPSSASVPGICGASSRSIASASPKRTGATRLPRIAYISPRRRRRFFLGRGMAALAADPGSARFAGGFYGSWDLAQEYGVSDVDGSRPDFGRHFRGPGA